MACETSILQLGLCEGDIYVESVFYNTETEILSVTLNNGTVYTTSVPITEVEISAASNNQVQLLVDGLYVPMPLFGINNLAFENGENLKITSDDESITLNISKSGDEIILDLSSVPQEQHPQLSVIPNTEYNFNIVTQTLNIPLPTLTQDLENSNIFTYDPGDGTNNASVITLHDPLSVTTNAAPFSFDDETQALNLPQATLVDNNDNTYTYNPGNGDPSIVIDLSAAIVNITEALNNSSINDLGNVNAGNATSGQVLQWDGINWVPVTLQTNDIISSITVNPDGSYVHNTGTGITTLIETARMALQPFAAEGQLQQTRQNSLGIATKVYRSAAIGIGVTSTRQIQGMLDVAGNVYINNTGTTAKLYLQAQYGTTDEEELVIKLVNKSNTYHYILSDEDTSRSLMTVDKVGNIFVGQVGSNINEPDNIYNAEGTFSISNYNTDTPPSIPLSPFTVTDFVIIK